MRLPCSACVTKGAPRNLVGLPDNGPCYTLRAGAGLSSMPSRRDLSLADQAVGNFSAYSAHLKTPPDVQRMQRSA